MEGYVTVAPGRVDDTTQHGRHYPFTETGMMDAYRDAEAHGYEVWETWMGEPHAIVHTARHPREI